MKTRLIPLAVAVCGLAVVSSFAQPTIVTELADQTTLAGSNATFCVVATGTPPLSYQWRDYETPAIYTNIVGATNACLELAAVSRFEDQHRFLVEVSNPAGSVSSRMAKLTVHAPPLVTSEPADQKVSLEDTCVFQVAAAGDLPFAYQWYFVGAGTTNLLVGKTSSTLSIPNLQFGNEGDYFVTITNLYGATNSRLAHLTVVGPGATFTKITTGPIPTDLGYSVGVAWGDYDGDGWVDLFVANNFWEATSAPNFLYHNLGQGVFE